MVRSQAPGKSLLITDDGTEVTTKLVRSFQGMGWQRIVVLQFPQSLVRREGLLSENVTVLSLKTTALAELKTALQGLEEQQGAVANFIHLHPEFRGQELFPEAEKALLKQVFFIAKHLKLSLNQAAQEDQASFMTVTRLDGKLGTGNAADFGVIAGGFFGLVKTLNIEWKPVFCRALDLSPELEKDLQVQHILREFSDFDRTKVEVGQNLTGRCTLVGDLIASIEQERSPEDPITASSVFLVSGGGKGVTAACVIQLAKRYQCRFILLGRSAISESEPQWAQGCEDQVESKKRIMNDFLARADKPTPMKVQKTLNGLLSNREILQNLQLMRQAGAQVEYISADITDATQLQVKLAPLTAKLGPITGVIHGAGVLADKLIEKKTEQDFDSVFGTKVGGLEAILKAVSRHDLHTLILFSSAAGFYGNEAQSDYAVANEVLNKTAQRIRKEQPKCHVVSFNWGPWDGGMVTDQLKKMFRERNIEIIPIEQGSRLMVDELHPQNIEIAQAVVGSSMVVTEPLGETLRSFQVERRLSLEENGFVKDHQIGGEAVLPLVSALSWMVESCEKLYPGYAFASAENTQVLNGITFNDSLADRYQVELKEVFKSEVDGLALAVKVSSVNSAGKPRFHYSSQINLAKIPSSRPQIANLDLTEDNAQAGSELYQNGTLFHGKTFREIERVLRFQENKLILACRSSHLDEQAQGQFPVNGFNAFADDVLLQAMLVWVRLQHQSGSLPLKIQQATCYEVIPFGTAFFITLEVVKSSAHKLIATVTSHDGAGNIYSRFDNAEVTISKALNDKFLPAT